MSDEIQWRSRTRLVDEVAHVMRERIYSGVYPSGTPLRQLQIAADLSISRTPLREALRMLESEGLVTNDARRGVVVVGADLRRLINGYLMREIVDGLAARLAAERASAKSRDRLFEILERQKKSLDPWVPADYTRTNVDFHTAVIELADNEFLLAEIPLVRLTSEVFTPIKLLDLTRAESALGEHTLIAEAIIAGEPENAELFARQHVGNTLARLRVQLREAM